MPNINKALRRERKHQRKAKHVVDNRNIFILEEEKRKKTEIIKKEREEKQKLVESS